MGCLLLMSHICLNILTSKHHEEPKNLHLKLETEPNVIMSSDNNP